MKLSKHQLKSTALKEIFKLFELAEQQLSKNPDLSKKHVKKARKLAMHHKVKIPKQFKRRFCKKCHAFLVPSKNCRVRTKDGKVIISCLECKSVKRIPYK